MYLKNFFPLGFISAAFILSFTVLGCNNDDTNDTATVTTDSTTTTMMDTTTAPVMTDTMTSTTPTADNTAKTGKAKPNPAKKGMKGKVSVVIPTKTSTAEAKMEADVSGIYTNVEVLPSFPGGDKGLQKFFDNNLTYPEQASNDGVEGTVDLTFVVDENGKLTSTKATNEYLGYGLEDEALRVAGKMPAWNPGKLKGKNVKTRFTLPVRFVLQ